MSPLLAQSGHAAMSARCPLSGGKADMRCGVAAQRRSAGNEVHIEVSHCFQASSLGTHLKAKSHRWVCERMRSPGHVASACLLSGGEFNESTQHLLILADEEVCEWRGMHGHGSRRNRRLSCGSAGRAVNVWRTSRERLRGGTRAASIGSWLAMEGLLQRHAGGLW